MHEHEAANDGIGRPSRFSRYGFLAAVWVVWVVCLMVWAFTWKGTNAKPIPSPGQTAAGAGRQPSAPEDPRPPDSDALIAARQLLAAGDFAAAAGAFEAITRRDPTNGRAWFNLAYAMHAMGDLERAIPLHRKAAEFPRLRSAALYNLACAYALTGASDQALSSLAQAVEAGFGNTALMETDPDLMSIRQDERYSEIRKAAAKNRAANPRPLALN